MASFFVVYGFLYLINGLLVLAFNFFINSLFSSVIAFKICYYLVGRLAGVARLVVIVPLCFIAFSKMFLLRAGDGLSLSSIFFAVINGVGFGSLVIFCRLSIVACLLVFIGFFGIK